MTEITDREVQRAKTEDGGWTIVWGDLINEFDAVQLIVTVPTGTVGVWVAAQVEEQLRKFNQSMNDVSDDVVQQASEYLTTLLRGKHSGEREINGVGVKAGIVTYHRKLKTPFFTTKLPDNHQPYIGVRVSKPLPPRGPLSGNSLDKMSWYKIKNAIKPGMALDIVNDGNQQRDGKLQMAAEGNFSGQHWQLRPSKISPGAYNLCTMWLGTSMCLDVYGDDKTHPHLATAGSFSGQQWSFERQGSDTWQLRNSYSGPLVLTADVNGNEIYMRDPQGDGASQWTLQRVRPITEGGFSL